ncbi:MAG: hypothetical protein LQ351_004216 [Letrouitia transgressa]|nr:MAG: hypothetical protein LQ351_004216 [Letrouitia transgressa]
MEKLAEIFTRELETAEEVSEEELERAIQRLLDIHTKKIENAEEIPKKELVLHEELLEREIELAITRDLAAAFAKKLYDAKEVAREWKAMSKTMQAMYEDLLNSMEKTT